MRSGPNDRASDCPRRKASTNCSSLCSPRQAGPPTSVAMLRRGCRTIAAEGRNRSHMHADFAVRRSPALPGKYGFTAQAPLNTAAFSSFSRNQALHDERRKNICPSARRAFPETPEQNVRINAFFGKPGKTVRRREDGSVLCQRNLCSSSVHDGTGT